MTGRPRAHALPAPQVQRYNARIVQLQQELLQRLSESDSLLEDGNLLDLLAKTKQMAQVSDMEGKGGPLGLQGLGGDHVLC